MREQLKAILLRHEGRNNPIKARELSELLHEPERTIRLAIRSLVDEGLPVCSTTSSPPGYFIPMDMNEARQSTEPMRAVCIDTFVRRRRILRNVDLYLKNGKQMKLEV